MDQIHQMIQFGLTHQEARLYIALYGMGETTGYELAKRTGISRSNCYAGLASLVEKGAAWLADGKPLRYQAVPVGEFCGNVVRGLCATQLLLEQELREPREDTSSYLTIQGERNIQDKIETLILQTRAHIYLSMPNRSLRPFLRTLEQAVRQGRKVVVITDSAIALEGAAVYQSPERSSSIRVISDTQSALTGSLTGPGCSCLFSREQNLVSLLRDSIRNELRIIEITGGANR